MWKNTNWLCEAKLGPMTFGPFWALSRCVTLKHYLALCVHCFIQWTLYWISSARQLYIKKSNWKLRNSLGLYFLHCTVCKGRAGKLCLITWHEGMIIGRNVVLIRKRNINPPVSASPVGPVRTYFQFHVMSPSLPPPITSPELIQNNGHCGTTQSNLPHVAFLITDHHICWTSWLSVPLKF